MKPTTPMPERLTLPALQRYVARMVEERGFTHDVDRVFILLVEELGELAGELNAYEAGGAEGSRKLAFELADVTLYLVDLANGLGLDLEAALGAYGEAEPRTLAARQAAEPRTLAAWQAAEPCTLAAWQAAEQQSVTAAWRGLAIAVGETATHLRKRWAGRPVDDPGRPLAEALRAVLALANAVHADLEDAVREKERVNATRTWTY